MTSKQKFDITQHIQFSSKGRGSCPVCESGKGKVNTNLSLVPGTDGAYKCFRGCTPDDIRSALGVQRDRQVPAALVQSSTPAGKVTVSPQKVMEAHKALMESNGPAKAWLQERGITEGMIQRYRLGIVRAKCGDRRLPAISIPIPNHDGTAYYQKKRVAPWLKPSDLAELPDYKPWSQAGIPAQTYFTWLPAEATETILCEGEWDAMLLGQMMRQQDKSIAVASFTAGCGNLPKEPRQFDLLPGTVYVCYDLDAPGEKGASKVAAALGTRARLMTCPMSSAIKSDDPAADTIGWDISDAINSGSSIGDFLEAMKQATAIAVVADNDVAPEKKRTTLRDRLVSNTEMMAAAPDYVEMLVPDLLPANEMIMLAAGARAGKSLLAMLLAKCVATGENFLDRPVIQGSVLYVCCEDSPVKLKQREIAQGWEHDIPVYWLNRFKMSQLPELRDLAIELDVRLIILDTLSRVRDDGVNESSSEMSRVMEPYQELAEELGCCIVLVHHTNKISVENAGSIDVFDTIRGSSAIRATCRGSIVLAADNGCYRLCAENGYGKTDLKVKLNNDTLTWHLLGRWTQDDVSTDLKSIVLDYLTKVGEATIEQVFEETQISKNSLYKTLSRLAGDGMIAKSGHRRNVIYRRSIGLIGQSDTLSDSRKLDTAVDRGSIGQKIISVTTPDKVISDQSVTCANLITSSIDDHFEAVSDKHAHVSDNSQKAGTVSVSAIGQLSDKGHLSDEADQSDGSDPYIRSGKSSAPFNCTLEPGDVCNILTGRSKGKEVTVLRYEPKYPDTLWVNDGKKREISFHRSELGLIRRAGDANG